jgi:hypothetical protein
MTLKNYLKALNFSITKTKEESNCFRFIPINWGTKYTLHISSSK